MSSTLQALADLFIQSVPTIVFFIVLTYYLKYIFFRPLQRVLDERRKVTESAKALGDQANAEADKQLLDFEQALQHARAEIYKNNEVMRKQWTEEQIRIIDQARADAQAKLADAKKLIEQELRQAEKELDATVEPLSEQIVESLLRRRAA